MKVLQKLTRKNLLLNKKRTTVTIIGIILATALITAVANMAVSFQASMVEYEKQASGRFHYVFYNVSTDNHKYFENNKNVETVGYTADLGYAILPNGKNERKPYLYLMMADEAAFDEMSMQLVEGRLPEHDNEIVISKHIWSNGGVEYQLGDVITLDVGNRYYRSNEAEENETQETILNQNWDYCYDDEIFVPEKQVTYTVVGIMEQPIHQIEQIYAPGYTVIVGWNADTAPETQDIYVTYTKEGLRNRKEVTAGLLNVSYDLYMRWEQGQTLSDEEWEQIESVANGVYANVWLIKWELLEFSNDTMTTLYMAAGIAIGIIILTSVFCIRNSFVISLTEKMKLYGMLSSVGTTKRQRKKLVYQEALILACIGIPLGIAVGILAIWIVIQATTGLAETGFGIPLVFAVSVPAIGAALVLSFVTILLSAGQSARKAAKVSPITAIRGNETIRQKKQNLKVPKIIKAWFGIGGVLAYKNLKRARVKYRTTVISIVVSVAIFIGMFSFLRLGMQTEKVYYTSISYQIMVSIYGEQSLSLAQEVAEQNGVAYAEIRQMAGCRIPAEELTLTPEYQKLFGYSGTETITMKDVYGTEESSDTVYMNLIMIGEDAFESYCKKLGLQAEDMQGKAVLVNNYQMTASIDGKTKYTTGMFYDCKAGDVLHVSLREESDDTEELSSPVTLAAVTDIRPMCIENYAGAAYLVVRNDFFEQCFGTDENWSAYFNDACTVFIQCDAPDELEQTLTDLLTGVGEYYIGNMKEDYEQSRSMYLLFSVFLYGFIIVIALIGITNIFNTITTNMELRTWEFAMLKSIGMTRKEFRRMVCLESVFYGIKSLGIGIIIGVLISICFYQAFVQGSMEMAYHLPYESILISILAVILLLIIIMSYSMAKINGKNIIEAIQTENI